MLDTRILNTLRFFDLQEMPLTLFELHKFLISDLHNLKLHQSENFELRDFSFPKTPVSLSVGEKVLQALLAENKIDEYLGYYFLPGRKEIVQRRLTNYYYGIYRERLIKRYVRFLRFLPFVRGVALAGSQALGQEKPTSDIDLFIITDAKFMWTARTLVSLYFHMVKKRRHGKYIANRFCLNHYVAGEKMLSEGRNLYAASEYVKLRPLLNSKALYNFKKNNLFWLEKFFPNFSIYENLEIISPDSVLQLLIEKLFQNNLGILLENYLKTIQKKRIHTDQYVRVSEDELSFHPHSKQEKLLLDFFKF